MKTCFFIVLLGVSLGLCFGKPKLGDIGGDSLTGIFDSITANVNQPGFSDVINGILEVVDINYFINFFSDAANDPDVLDNSQKYKNFLKGINDIDLNKLTTALKKRGQKSGNDLPLNQKAKIIFDTFN